MLIINNKNKTMNKKEEFKNPNQYGYRGNEAITIDGATFRQLKREIEFQMSKEIIEGFVEPTKKVNPENYQEATKKQIEAGEFVEVTDIEALLQQDTPQVIFTPRGKNLTMLKLNLEKVHYDNIESGLAVPIDTLKEEFEKSKQPKLKKV